MKFFLLQYIFQSVTAYGRTMIEQTKQEVEHKYCVKNGYDHDAVVSNIFIQWLILFVDLPNFLLFQKTTQTFIIYCSLRYLFSSQKSEVKQNMTSSGLHFIVKPSIPRERQKIKLILLSQFNF